MALPRTTEEVQEQYTKLGIEAAGIISLIVDLAKGEVPSPQGDWFYNLLAKDLWVIHNTVYPIDVIQNKLQNSWLTKEDIRQSLYLHILSRKIYVKLGSLYFFRYILARYVTDVIAYSKIFIQPGATEAYQIHLTNSMKQDFTIYERTRPFEEILFAEGQYGGILQELTVFERYLIYLFCTLSFTQEEIAAILLTSRRQVVRFFAKLKVKLEDSYASGRISESTGNSTTDAR